jgi:8-oxo-dGTP diphosphatase
MWEFPGGKLNPGESLAEGLRREMWEELQVLAELGGEPLLQVEDPGSHYVIVFVPARILGEPTLLEHEESRWVAPADLQDLSLAPSDSVFAELVLSRST